jgi:hypothetical protein
MIDGRTPCTQKQKKYSYWTSQHLQSPAWCPNCGEPCLSRFIHVWTCPLPSPEEDLLQYLGTKFRWSSKDLVPLNEPSANGNNVIVYYFSIFSKNSKITKSIYLSTYLLICLSIVFGDTYEGSKTSKKNKEMPNKKIIVMVGVHGALMRYCQCSIS